MWNPFFFFFSFLTLMRRINSLLNNFGIKSNFCIAQLISCNEVQTTREEIEEFVKYKPGVRFQRREKLMNNEKFTIVKKFTGNIKKKSYFLSIFYTRFAGGAWSNGYRLWVDELEDSVQIPVNVVASTSERYKSIFSQARG